MADAQSRSSRPIDVSFHRADIHHVLEFFADALDLNFVYGGGVEGQVTLRLRRVPAFEALRVILDALDLAMEQRGNVIYVASRETLLQQREHVITARAQCLASAPLRTRVIRVSYARAEALADLVRSRLTSRGSVSVDDRTNSLIIRDVECR